jgi:hypothetical protein
MQEATPRQAMRRPSNPPHVGQLCSTVFLLLLHLRPPGRPLFGDLLNVVVDGVQTNVALLDAHDYTRLLVIIALDFRDGCAMRTED